MWLKKEKKLILEFAQAKQPTGPQVVEGSRLDSNGSTIL